MRNCPKCSSTVGLKVNPTINYHLNNIRNDGIIIEVVSASVTVQIFTDLDAKCYH